MKESSTDYVPEGYIIPPESVINYTSPCRCGCHIAQSLKEIRGCGLCRHATQEPFKLTEEEYQWLISLCSGRSG